MIAPPPDIEESIQWAAKAAKAPVAIVRSVAYHESRYNPGAISPVGAKGLMQLMPVNLKQYVVSDPFDPEQSARVGAEILVKLKKRHGTWERAIAAYQWGTGNVKKKPNRSQWPQKTRDYVDKVLRDANIAVARVPSESTGNVATLLLAGIPVILAVMRFRS